MLTIAVAVFGITLVNWHFDFVSEIAKKSPEIASLLNDALQKILATPLEWQPSVSIVRLDVKLGADATILAPNSRAVTAVAPGTIKAQPVHPDVQPVLSTPAPGDLDDSVDPGTVDTTAPADAPALTDGPLGMLTADKAKETPLQKALETNKAGK